MAIRCGVTIHAVRSWIQRDSIPPDLWECFVETDWSTLEELFAGVKPRKRPEAAAA